MKIAILTSSFLPNVGGAQVFAYNIAKQLAASGNAVHTYVSAKDFSALTPRFRDLLKPLPRGFYGLIQRVPVIGLLRAQRYLLGQQRAEGYDAWLVIVTFPSGYVAACLKGRVPIALRASGADIQKSPELDYGLRLDGAQESRISRVVRSYDRLVALSESVRTDYLDLGAADEDIVIIPNGVDLEWFAPRRSVAEVRSELGWPQDRLVILTTGRNHRKKGFNLIPAIADKLRSQGLRFRWYVVGRDVDGIKGEVRTRGLEVYVMTHDEVGVDNGPDAQAYWRSRSGQTCLIRRGALRHRRLDSRPWDGASGPNGPRSSLCRVPS